MIQRAKAAEAVQGEKRLLTSRVLALYGKRRVGATTRATAAVLQDHTLRTALALGNFKLILAAHTRLHLGMEICRKRNKRGMA